MAANNWPCPACTLINLGGAGECAACGRQPGLPQAQGEQEYIDLANSSGDERQQQQVQQQGQQQQAQQAPGAGLPPLRHMKGKRKAPFLALPKGMSSPTAKNGAARAAPNGAAAAAPNSEPGPREVAGQPLGPESPNSYGADFQIQLSDFTESRRRAGVSGGGSIKARGEQARRGPLAGLLAEPQQQAAGAAQPAAAAQEPGSGSSAETAVAAERVVMAGEAAAAARRSQLAAPPAPRQEGQQQRPSQAPASVASGSSVPGPPALRDSADSGRPTQQQQQQQGRQQGAKRPAGAALPPPSKKQRLKGAGSTRPGAAPSSTRGALQAGAGKGQEGVSPPEKRAGGLNPLPVRKKKRRKVEGQPAAEQQQAGPAAEAPADASAGQQQQLQPAAAARHLPAPPRQAGEPQGMPQREGQALQPSPALPASPSGPQQQPIQASLRLPPRRSSLGSSSKGSPLSGPLSHSASPSGPAAAAAAAEAPPPVLAWPAAPSARPARPAGDEKSSHGPAFALPPLWRGPGSLVQKQAHERQLQQALAGVGPDSWWQGLQAEFGQGPGLASLPPEQPAEPAQPAAPAGRRQSRPGVPAWVQRARHPASDITAVVLAAAANCEPVPVIEPQQVEVVADPPAWLAFRLAARLPEADACRSGAELLRLGAAAAASSTAAAPPVFGAALVAGWGRQQAVQAEPQQQAQQQQQQAGEGASEPARQAGEQQDTRQLQQLTRQSSRQLAQAQGQGREQAEPVQMDLSEAAARLLAADRHQASPMGLGERTKRFLFQRTHKLRKELHQRFAAEAARLGGIPAAGGGGARARGGGSGRGKSGKAGAGKGSGSGSGNGGEGRQAGSQTYTGVRLQDNGTYITYFHSGNGKMVWLGTYSRAEEAARAVDLGWLWRWLQGGRKGRPHEFNLQGEGYLKDEALQRELAAITDHKVLKAHIKRTCGAR